MSRAQSPNSSNIIAVERAIGVLANTMRLYVETYIRFGELFDIDREEAINNLDRAFEAKLNAFHSLYDVSKGLFSYFDHGDTALLIAVRNALHHHENPLFHSFLSRLYLEDDPSRWQGASFLLASYPTRHGAPIIMSHAIRLDDICARLDPTRASPQLDTHVKGSRAMERFRVIERDLALGEILRKGAVERYPEDQIYVDLVPLFTSAVCRVFKALKAAGVTFKGDDARAYLKPFTSEIDVDLKTLTFKTLVIGKSASAGCEPRKVPNSFR